MPKSLLRTLGLLAAGAAIPTTMMAVQTARAAESTAQDNDTYKQLDQFMNVFQTVKAQYVDKTTDKELIKGAIDGMLASLDPHSSYLEGHDVQQMKITTEGKYGGLGLTVQADSGAIKVVTPQEDTPAWKAGIKSGDYITRVDGKNVYGETLDDAVDHMRGDPGTKVTLTIFRPGRDKPFDIALTREIISLQSVKWQVKDHIGIININGFSQPTGADVRKAITEITKANNGLPTGYVVDLRDNPGGLLDQAVSVSSAFLSSGEVVSQRGRDKDDIQRYYVTPGSNNANGLPIVVLVNAGTASAAEIVAGALQDHRRAIVMGERSFGKGSVQTLIPLTNDSEMRLTTARYFTPSGHSVQEGGIQPDVMVPQLSDPDYKDRPKFREDDLRRHLINEAKVDDSVLEADSKTDPRFTATADQLKKQGVNDFQLSYALQTLERLAPAAQRTRVAIALPPTGAEAPSAN